MVSTAFANERSPTRSRWNLIDKPRDDVKFSSNEWETVK